MHLFTVTFLFCMAFMYQVNAGSFRADPSSVSLKDTLKPGEGYGFCQINEIKKEFKYRLNEIESLQTKSNLQFAKAWSFQEGTDFYSCTLAYCCGRQSNGTYFYNFQVDADQMAKLTDATVVQHYMNFHSNVGNVSNFLNTQANINFNINPSSSTSGFSESKDAKSITSSNATAALSNANATAEFVANAAEKVETYTRVLIPLTLFAVLSLF